VSILDIIAVDVTLLCFAC